MTVLKTSRTTTNNASFFSCELAIGYEIRRHMFFGPMAIRGLKFGIQLSRNVADIFIPSDICRSHERLFWSLRLLLATHNFW